MIDDAQVQVDDYMILYRGAGAWYLAATAPSDLKGGYERIAKMWLRDNMQLADLLCLVDVCEIRCCADLNCYKRRPDLIVHRKPAEGGEIDYMRRFRIEPKGERKPADVPELERIARFGPPCE